MTAEALTPAPEVTNEAAKPAAPRPQVVAFRHGVSGQMFVFSPAEAPAFREHCAAIRSHYQPVGHVECFLTGQISHGMWRLQRAAAIEEGLFAIDAATAGAAYTGPAYSWLEKQKALTQLMTYENRIRRALDRDKAELAALQASRQQGEQPAPKPKSVCSKRPTSFDQAIREALFAPLPSEEDPVLTRAA